MLAHLASREIVIFNFVQPSVVKSHLLVTEEGPSLERVSALINLFFDCQYNRLEKCSKGRSNGLISCKKQLPEVSDNKKRG